MRRSALLLGLLATMPLAAQPTLIPLDMVPSSGMTLEIERFAQIPLEQGVTARHTTLSLAPGQDNALYVATHGAPAGGESTASIYSIDRGTRAVSTFFELGNALDPNNGPVAGGIEYTREGGLRSFAFHPDYDNPAAPGYRKFYESHQEPTANFDASLTYLGQTTVADMADSVVGEWTVAANGQVDPTSYREVLRVALPWYAHPAKKVAFNPYATPSDEDYGLLYFAHGDAGTSTSGTGQIGSDAEGKLLRINPLQDGANAYSVPGSNPFTAANDPSDLVLDEVYALGFRNPHKFAWATDSGGAVRMILSDIGYDNVEEVNIVVPGGNYGWRIREGTFQHIGLGTGTGIGVGIQNLPPNEAALNDFIFPAAQYGHPLDGSAAAITGGYVIEHGDMAGEYIYGDFPNTGKVFHSSLEDLLNAKTFLENGEDPSLLTTAPIEEVSFLFDDDNNPATPSVSRTLNQIITQDPDFEGGNRVDIGFGQGPEGELYILNKRNGWVYLATNTLPPLLCDFGGDGDCDVPDIDNLVGEIVAGTNNPLFDLTGDGLVNGNDLDEFLVQAGNFEIGAPYLPGDANLDGTVDGTDFIRWNTSKFTNVALWSQGDFNADGVVDGQDFIIWNAFKFQSSTDGLLVPEPAPQLSLFAVWLLLMHSGRFAKAAPRENLV